MPTFGNAVPKEMDNSSPTLEDVAFTPLTFTESTTKAFARLTTILLKLAIFVTAFICTNPEIAVEVLVAFKSML